MLSRRFWLVITSTSVVLTLLAIALVDEPLARWTATFQTSRAWDRVLAVLEYGAGIEPWRWTMHVLLCSGVVVTLAVPRLRRFAPSWMFLAMVFLASKTVMLWGKTLTGRYRPGQWLIFGGSSWGHIGDGVSFPSGHVMTFAGLLVPLAVMLPRLRIPAAVILAYVSLARLAVNAHFLSDVFGGFAAVFAITWACLPIYMRSFLKSTLP